VLLDPFAYPTRKTALRFNMMRLSSARWIMDYARRGARRMAKALWRSGDQTPAGTPGASPQRGYVRRAPPIEEFSTCSRQLLDRGGAVFAAYSGSSFSQFNYPEQLDEVLSPFGLGGGVRCTFYPEANHTFTELCAQRALIESVLPRANQLVAGAEASTGRVL
jgi:hypothetical protein